MNSIKDNIKGLFTYIKTSLTVNRKMFYIAILLFVIPTVMAYFMAPFFKSSVEPVISTMRKQITSGQITLTYLSIFSNNFHVLFRMYWGGIVAGILPAILMVFNGLIIGYFLTRGSFMQILLFILPHGIFEIPGLIFGGAAGFTLFKFIYYLIKDIWKPDWDFILNKTTHKDKNGLEFSKGQDISLTNRFIISFDKNNDILIQSFVIFLIGVVLLMIAAYIEVYITKDLANYLIQTYHIK